MATSPLVSLKKHLVGQRLDLAQKDVAAGALQVFQEPTHTPAEVALVRKALEEVWASAAGKSPQGKVLTIQDPQVIRAQWAWLLDQGLPAMVPSEGFALVSSMLSLESPMIGAADWLIERGMLDVEQMQGAPCLMVSAVLQKNDAAMLWLLAKGVPADPPPGEPVVHAPHNPPPLWAAIEVHIGNAHSKVHHLLAAGAQLRPGAWASATPHPSAPLVTLARRQAGSYGGQPDLEWSNFFAVWDELVAAGADPDLPDATGVSASQALRGTPGEAWWLAQRRAARDRDRPLPAPRPRRRS